MSGARDYRLPRDALVNARLRNAGLAPACVAGEEMVFKPDLKEVILNTRPADLIAYWPLDEQRNNRAHDYAGQRRNGTHVGVDLAKPGIGDGRTCPYYDGANDYTNIYSASLAAAFSGAEGTLGIFAKVAGPQVWTDGAQRNLVTLKADDNNYVAIYRSTTNNTIVFAYKAGGTLKIVNYVTGSLAWIGFCLRWSSTRNLMTAYVNGRQTGATQVGLGAWVGSLAATTTTIGAGSTIPANVMSGYLAHIPVWRSALSPIEIYNIALAAGLAAA